MPGREHTMPAPDVLAPHTAAAAARRERVLRYLQDTPGMRYTALEVADVLEIDPRLIERDLTTLAEQERVRHERHGVAPARGGRCQAQFWVEDEP